MWFENLDPESIKQRLRKDGPFFKELEDVRFGEPGEDEDGEEPETIEETLSLVETAAEHILLPKLSGIPKIDVVEEETYKRIRINDGDGLLELLAMAKSSIYVTHFLPKEFTERYISLQLEKVRAGIVFERLVKFHKHYPEAYHWLKRFFDNDNKPINRYRQYKVQGELRPFYEIMIVDEKYVVAWLKIQGDSHERDEALFFESKRLAANALNMWRHLIPRGDQDSNKMEFVVSRQGGMDDWQ